MGATGSSINILLEEALKLIFKVINNKLDGYEIWLLIGNSSWQEDNRIIRYRKLFGSLKNNGVVLDNDNLESYEILVEKDNKIKFFCAKKLTLFSVNNVIKAIMEEPNSYVLAVPADIDIKPILKHGWINDNGFDKELISYALKNKSLLIMSFGAFDDIEAGFTGVCNSELIIKIKG